MKYLKFLVIDTLIFTTLAIVSEWVGFTIHSGPLMYLSFLPAFVILMLVRWKYYGLITLGLTAIARPLIWGASSPKEFMFYIIPVLVLALTLVIANKKVMEQINSKKSAAMLFYSTLYIIFVVAIGVSGLIFLSSDFSIANELLKHLITFAVGNILYYLMSSQKTMLVDIIGLYKEQNNAKESETNGK